MKKIKMMVSNSMTFEEGGNESTEFEIQVKHAIDISYIPMGRSDMYLTAIIDWHSRYIVGYKLSDTLQVESVLLCVNKTIKRHGIPEIINSDQGSQFTSHDYTNLLKSYNIKISMDGKGRWADNIIIERFFRTLKYDDIYIYQYQTPRELKSGINNFMKSTTAVKKPLR